MPHHARPRGLPGPRLPTGQGVKKRGRGRTERVQPPRSCLWPVIPIPLPFFFAIFVFLSSPLSVFLCGKEGFFFFFQRVFVTPISFLIFTCV